MQQDKLYGYYNIDFEKEMNINDFEKLLIKKFPTCNIHIESEDETIEHCFNNDNDKFEIWMTVGYLKTDGIYDFEDVKIRVMLDIMTDFEVRPIEVIIALKEVSRKFNTKIYIPMQDVDKGASFTYSDYTFWCIDNDKRKIVFDSEEFDMNPKNLYCDYMPF
ncbi:hypothetical protein [Psychrobacter sp. FDAARGOS_221]|uniref:hypothetical protein n=1 Tax=Psychrobacter sp. FDAARGOS_221 TaxID=1975705 RepID=UPI000BB595CD|nr:hypothetical protein [Psychrobacter sp. FDAARGOS_221]PNK61593.1 hypothetical protein A6J60_012440 [Psychrobacter sp. FDAARGOS_221]